MDYKALGFQPATIASAGPTEGTADAVIEVTIFGDYTSTYSERASAQLQKLFSRLPGRLRVRYRVHPEYDRPSAAAAAEAVLCAAAQGRFLEYRTALLSDARDRQTEELEALARGVGVNEAAFARCLQQHEQAGLVAEHVKDYDKNSLQGTPAPVINGFVFGGVVPSDDLVDFVEDVRDGVFL